MFRKTIRHNISNSNQVNQTHLSSERPPYKTWDCFEKATGNHFRPLFHKGKLVKTCQELKQEAWRIYSATQSADDKRFTQFPFAITYTGADYSVLQRLKDYPCFNKNENLDSLHKAGWVYIPEIHHSWCLNGIWVLSQVHKGRSFVSVSDASFKISAYTKELHCIFKAGYKVSSLTFLSDGHTLVHLTPPVLEIAQRVKFEDFMKISPEDCEHAQTKFNAEKQDLVRKTHPTDKKIFSQIAAIAQTNVLEQNGIFLGTRIIPHLSLFSLQQKFLETNYNFPELRLVK